MKEPRIKALFWDIGGVLLTNGWDRRMRAQAAQVFALDPVEMDERHHLTFAIYEEGKLTLDDYLNQVVFYEERSFSRQEFKEFMFAQSKPYPEMVDLARRAKASPGLKTGVISNEGRELTVYRIHQFGLWEFIDFFVCSCFVHYRKPDLDIYRIALDIAQVEGPEAVYVEDRGLFVETAQSLGIRSVHHRGYETTRAALAALGVLK